MAYQRSAGRYPKGGWRVFVVAVGLILITCVAAGESLADDVKAAEERAKGLQDALRLVNDKLAPLKADAAAVRQAVRKAGDALFAAREALAAQQEAERALEDADRRLVAEEKRIESFVKKYEAMPDGAKGKRDLGLLIESYRESLRKAARRYREAKEELERKTAEAAAAVSKAWDAFVAALQVQGVKEAVAAKALDDKLDADRKVSASVRELFEASLKDAPPYLKEVQIKQDGKTVYHARWVPDRSLRDFVLGHIAELEAELADLEDRLGKVREDRQRYWKAVVGSPKGAALVGGWNLERAFVRMGKGVKFELRYDILQGRSNKRPIRTRWAYPIVAKALSAPRVLPRETWDFHLDYIHDDAGEVPRKIAEDIIDTALDQLAKREAPERRCAVYPLFPSRSESDDIVPPGYENVRRAIVSAEISIRVYHREHITELDAGWAIRQGLEQGFLAKLVESARGRLEELKADDPDEAPKHHPIYHAMVEQVNLALNSLAWEEIHYLEEVRIPSKRRQIDELAALLPDASLWRLEVVAKGPLKIGKGLKADVALTFSSFLASSPTVVFGKHTPGGLPKDGARMDSFEGSAATWTGVLDTEKLEPFATDKGGVSLHVAARDPSGRALDANPITEAGKTQRGVWKNWDELRDSPGRMTGGIDTWHMVNLDPASAISYCFVVDASGSMRDHDRMANVKGSAKAFIEKMEKWDEVAMWVFFGCGDIRLLLPFTDDKQKLVEVLAGVNPSQGTPLAAAIYSGGNYLMTRGKYANKVLVVLTDGQETCQGDPQAAAAYFRKHVRVIGYGAGGPPPKPEAPDKPKPPERKPRPEPVKVQPADRRSFEVSQIGRGRFPSVVLKEIRFHEWGQDNNCRVLVTEKKYYVYYGESATRGWGVNSRPHSTRVLAAATSSQGKAAMDRVRQAWARLPGVSREEADDEIERRVNQILDALKAEDSR